MNSSETTEIIRGELISDDEEVRNEFSSRFSGDIERFSVAMGEAVCEWQRLDKGIEDASRAYVSALVHASLNLHVVSFKLFLSGHVVPSGNTFRQVIESIALALLCSCRELDVLSAFQKDQYSSKNAVRDVARNWRKIGLLAGSSKQLKDAQEFYGQYSHVTQLTLANMVSFSEKAAYVGAAFDISKIDAYRREIEGRVGLAEVMSNAIAAVRANLDKWPMDGDLVKQDDSNT